MPPTSLRRRSCDWDLPRGTFRVSHLDPDSIDLVKEKQPAVVITFSDDAFWSFVYWTLVILSAGLLFLLSYWFKSLKHKMTRRLAENPYDATCCEVISQDGSVVRTPCRAVMLSQSEYRLAMPAVHYSAPVLSKSSSDQRSARNGHVPLEEVMIKVLVFEYRCQQFGFNPFTCAFECITFHYRNLYPVAIHLRYNGGVSDPTIWEQRRLLYGPASVEVPIQPLFQLLLQEAFHPFYIFQMAAIAMWLSDGYVQYAYAVLAITVVSLVTEVFETRSAQLRLARMAKFECEIEVLRNQGVPIHPNSDIRPIGKSPAALETLESSRDLVPGDVVRLSHGMTLPCDMILLTGRVVVNEAMLTGESVPIVKLGLPPVGFQDGAPTFEHWASSYILYGGTDIMDARATSTAASNSFAAMSSASTVASSVDDPSAPGVLALVVRTGFNTLQGQMLRTVLHPVANTSSDFKRDTYKFLAVLGCMALVGCCLSVYLTLSQGLSINTIIIRSLDTFPNAVPPALPATMAVGSTLAVTRLRRLWRIMCMAPSRINTAGQVSTVVFDKTGTLTEDGLRIEAVVPAVASPANTPPDLLTEEQFYRFLDGTTDWQDLPPMLRAAAGVCNGVCLIDGNPAGEPIELELLRLSGGILHECEIPPSMTRLDEVMPTLAEVQWPNLPHTWRVVRRFDFVAALLRMSVLVFDRGAQKLHLICKGSPEKLRSLCRPETLPMDYTAKLSQYASTGMRVLAFGWREIPFVEEQAVISEESCKTMINSIVRDSAESHLIFGGFAVFTNALKPCTKQAIQSLRNNGVRCIMATGDNPLTAAAVAKEAAFVDKEAFRSHIVADCDEKGRLLWTTTVPGCGEVSVDTDQLPFLLQGRDPRRMAVVVTGPAFRRIMEAQQIWDLSWATLDLSPVRCAGFRVGSRKLVSRRRGPRNWRERVEKELRVKLPRPRNMPRPVAPNADDGVDKSVEEKMAGNNKGNMEHDEDLANMEGYMQQSTEKDVEENAEDADDEPLKSVACHGSRCSWILQADVIKDDSKAPVTATSEHSLLPCPPPTTVQFSVTEWVLRFGRVFARMTPDDKAALVLALQRLPHQPLVGMCGDGANDCAALKAADVGVSLSQKEASMAAPFTSTTKSIVSLVDVLREGRGALVNSFQSFKFIALYAMVQLFSSLILYCYGSNLSDPQYLWIDLCIVLPLSMTMAWTGSSRVLTQKLPDRHLVGLAVILSLMGQVLIQLAFLGVTILLLSLMPWYVRYVPDGDIEKFAPEDLAGYENTCVFIVSSFQYIAVNIILACGRPWRKAPLTNYFYSTLVLVLYILSIFGFLFPVPPLRWLTTWAGVVDIPHFFRILLGVIVVCNLVLSIVFERLVVAGWAYRRGQKLDAGSQCIDLLLPLSLDIRVRFQACAAERADILKAG